MNQISDKEVIFIINPNSGTSKKKKILKSLDRLCPECTIHISDNISDLNLYIQENKHRFKVFVGVGGDGTISHLISLLRDDEKIFAIFPTGSGNGFARETGFNTSLKKILHAIRRGETQFFDLFEINNHICINLSGLGFDSLVANKFHEMKGRGLKNYMKATFSSLGSFKPWNSVISFEGTEIRGEYYMISIANTRQFGNNARIAPLANPSDGKISLVLVRPFPLILFPWIAFRTFLGNISKSSYFDYYETSNEVTINADFQWIHIDGDPKELINPISIKVFPDAVRFINPDSR